MSIEPRAFRRVMANFATGVTVLALRADERFYGMTASAVTSVSLEPTLVLVCIERSTRAHAYLQQSGEFTLSILSEGQRALSERFASDETAEERYLSMAESRTLASGLPILSGSLAYLDCTVAASHPGGDHTIFLGEVRDAAVISEDGTPLIYFRSGYRHLRG